MMKARILHALFLSTMFSTSFVACTRQSKDRDVKGRAAGEAKAAELKKQEEAKKAAEAKKSEEAKKAEEAKKQENTEQGGTGGQPIKSDQPPGQPTNSQQQPLAPSDVPSGSAAGGAPVTPAIKPAEGASGAKPAPEPAKKPADQKWSFKTKQSNIKIEGNQKIKELIQNNNIVMVVVPESSHAKSPYVTLENLYKVSEGRSSDEGAAIDNSVTAGTFVKSITDNNNTDKLNKLKHGYPELNSNQNLAIVISQLSQLTDSTISAKKDFRIFLKSKVFVATALNDNGIKLSLNAEIQNEMESYLKENGSGVALPVVLYNLIDSNKSAYASLEKIDNQSALTKMNILGNSFSIGNATISNCSQITDNLKLFAVGIPLKAASDNSQNNRQNNRYEPMASEGKRIDFTNDNDAKLFNKLGSADKQGLIVTAGKTFLTNTTTDKGFLGGPIVTEDGKLVGIQTYHGSANTQAEGISLNTCIQE